NHTPCLCAMFMISPTFVALPNAWTTTIPTVCGVIASSTKLAVICRVSDSQSTNTGLAPTWTIGQTVVGHASAGTITSAPGAMGSQLPPSCSDEWASADMSSRLADEPELTRQPL